jgi:hypothetical protein
MSCNSLVSMLAARRILKWLWLLVPTLVIFSSLRSYLILQLLSAMLLFMALFLFCGALLGAFLLVVVALDQLIQWSTVRLDSLGHLIQLPLRNTGIVPMWASAVSHVAAGLRTRK